MRPKRYILPEMPPLDAPLPPERGLHFDELKFRHDGSKDSAYVLDPVVRSAIIHHWDGRSVGCLRPRFACPVCDSGGEHIIRWEGYLTVSYGAKHPTKWIRVSQHMVKVCPDLLDKSKTLRGAKITFWRVGDARRGKKHAQLVHGVVPDVALPAPIDWDRFLRQQWEAEDRKRHDAPPDREDEIPH